MYRRPYKTAEDPAVNGAGSILVRVPAPAEVHRRPICGAGSAPVLEPADFS